MMRISALKRVQYTCILYLIFVQCFSPIAGEVRLPPTIVRSPIEQKIFRVDDEVTLECLATGVPQPSYEWLKDGKPLNYLLSNVHQEQENVLIIRPLSSLNEGYYQCVATNMFGKAVSRKTYLQPALIQLYKTSTTAYETAVIPEGSPLSLMCNHAKCSPRSACSYYWSIVRNPVDQNPIRLITNKRIQIGEDGSLNFAYITEADAQDDKLYKCNIFNDYLDLHVGGSYSKISAQTASQGSVPRSMMPSTMFSSPSPLLALEGKELTLRCFFAGNPIPRINWKIEGRYWPSRRAKLLNFNTKVIITDVTQSDEGLYICEGSNSEGTMTSSIHVEVHALPVFTTSLDSPFNQNVTVGDTVVMSCDAYAEPEANVQWLRNGVPLDSKDLPVKYRLSNGNKRLQIFDVCKECEDGTTDLAVIQCNASNQHGYSFAEGYVNVLERTIMTERPEDITVAYGEPMPAYFPCSGESDESTPVTISWYRVRSMEDHSTDQLVYNVPDKLVLGDDGSMTITIGENIADSLDFRGYYRCVIDNGYSQDEQIVLFDIEDPFISAMAH